MPSIKDLSSEFFYILEESTQNKLTDFIKDTMDDSLKYPGPIQLKLILAPMRISNLNRDKKLAFYRSEVTFGDCTLWTVMNSNSG